MNRFPNIDEEVQIGMDHPSRRIRGMTGQVVYVNEKLNMVEVLIPGVWQFRCTPGQLEEVKA